jgi:hypothetical protein
MRKEHRLMNLNTRKARAPIAALGVTALCATGLGAFATSASAAGESLAFGPTPTSATIVNVDPGATSLTAGLTYGVKATGSSGSGPLHLGVISTPAGASLSMERVAANGTPTANATFAGVTATAGNTAVTLTTTAGSATATLSAAPTLTGTTTDYSLAGRLIRIGTGASAEYATVDAHTTNTTTLTLSAPAANSQTTAALASGGAAASNNVFAPVAESDSAPVPGWASGDNVYFGATVPGTYTFRLFKDSNGNAIYEAGQDDSTPTFTLTVKDVTGNTVSTTDDLSFGLTAPTSVDLGQSITASATMGGLSTVDTRGLNSSSLGTLGVKLAAATQFDGTATSVTAGADASPTFDGTAFAHDFTTSGVAGSLELQPIVDKDGDGDFTSDYAPTAQKTTTTVASNGVTAVADPAVTEVEGSIVSGTNAATIKPGVASATYSTTVTDSGTKTDDLVYFTLTPGTNAPGLTGDGTLVSSTSGVKVYSVLANSSGVASITVTSSDTTNGTTYDVGAKSNAVTTATDVTATYDTAEEDTFSSTNTTLELNPTVPSSGTGSVTIKGKLLDQFGGGFQPTDPANNPVTVTVDANNSSYAGADTTGYATVGTDGTFSYTYVPATAATAGQSDYIRFAITGATSLSTTVIKWSSATAASAVTMTTPATGATAVTLQDKTAPNGAQGNAGSPAYGNGTGMVTGVVKDSANAGLAYKAVTLTGSAGVYFATDSIGTDLATSASVVTDSSGNYTGVRAFFTKAGTATVTATSGSVSATSTVTTSDAADPYTVTVNDVSGKPGATLIVTGTVKDAFGNVVPNTDVDLSIGTSTMGTLGDAQPTTNSLGVYSTTFVTGSNSDGTATLTATLHGQTANPTAAADWVDVAGITVPSGAYQDTATITLAETLTTITATGSLVGGGTAQLSGTAEAGASVEIWAKPAGATSFSLLDNEVADSDGAWSLGTSIVKTTAFFAKSDGKLSSTVSTVVFSTQTVKAKAIGKGKVRFTVLGTPNVRGFVNVYSGGKRIAHVATNRSGDVTTVVQSKAGRRTFRVYFVAPGTSLMGKSITGTVK